LKRDCFPSTSLIVALAHEIEHFFTGFVVQIARGLIRQKQHGICQKGPGDGHPLLLAT
jgi:hypothetical protein